MVDPLALDDAVGLGRPLPQQHLDLGQSHLATATSAKAHTAATWRQRSSLAPAGQSQRRSPSYSCTNRSSLGSDRDGTAQTIGISDNRRGAAGVSRLTRTPLLRRYLEDPEVADCIFYDAASRGFTLLGLPCSTLLNEPFALSFSDGPVGTFGVAPAGRLKLALGDQAPEIRGVDADPRG